MNLREQEARTKRKLIVLLVAIVLLAECLYLWSL